MFYWTVLIGMAYSPSAGWGNGIVTVSLPVAVHREQVILAASTPGGIIISRFNSLRRVVAGSLGSGPSFLPWITRLRPLTYEVQGNADYNFCSGYW